MRDFFLKDQDMDARLWLFRAAFRALGRQFEEAADFDRESCEQGLVEVDQFAERMRVLTFFEVCLNNYSMECHELQRVLKEMRDELKDAVAEGVVADAPKP